MMSSFPLHQIKKMQGIAPITGGKWHTLEQYVSFKRVLDEKQKGGEVLFKADEAVSINELPFPKHNNMGKEHVMTVSHVEREVDGDVAMQPEGILTGWLSRCKTCSST